MDWTKTNWENEEIQFKQKRHVNNKVSWKLPHIIGTFYSSKMERSVEYESINEFIFYAFLELDVKTIRYYIQPSEINISCLDNVGNKKNWVHIPDVLVFRQDSLPVLYQVKDPRSKESNKIEIINRACAKYVENKSWQYKVVYPKKLPEKLITNIRFLFGFIKSRKYYLFIIFLSHLIQIKRLTRELND
ncbi:TnsA endonuclease N-terminal domain-containing protein [Clostridium estertheticum]|uniref:TnsA endonuclease N-terminal domain-containing protein n=1 Tax=Clostridium estertheticum TaxID=238834 RepID=UPI001C0D98F4|nr:TnsA endonuclease N-terminal domain-containing protein [Clostridium estertheticum]MBU3198155.1 Tn7 transposase TnsA N-terminal domain-containing protein [Clostridium estertheticum]WAG65946.1 TnsA endonuclease N-terminal domain-containing protein [Clostridium estertheticum]